MTDGFGNLVGRHDYYPFGSEIPRTGQADEPTKKYTGHERDPHGLADYMLGRTYLYPFMRFATPDVARDGWNLYGYTGGNPVNYVDPDGNRQNPVTGEQGIPETPENGTLGSIRSNTSNPNVGLFGLTRNGGTRRHNSIDINAPEGTPVYAAEGGEVTVRENAGQAGNRLDIATEEGETLVYAHLESFANGLVTGDMVVEGEMVGFSGTTGNAGGISASEEHLHFAVLDSDAQRIDPRDWLNDPAASSPAISTNNATFDTRMGECQCTPVDF